MQLIKTLQPVVIIVAAFAAILAGIGLLVPVEHAARSQVALKRPIEEVWEIVGDLSTWPQWVKEFESMRPLPAGNNVSRWMSSGELGDVEIVVESSKEPYEFVTYMEAGPFRGRWFFDLSIVPAGTLLSITEVGEVENPLFRGMMAFQDTNGSIREFMEDLGTYLDQPVLLKDVDVTVEQMKSKLPSEE